MFASEFFLFHLRRRSPDRNYGGQLGPFEAPGAFLRVLLLVRVVHRLRQAGYQPRDFLALVSEHHWGELAKVGGREERGRVRGLEEFFYVHRSYSTQLVTIAIGAATIASVTRRAAGLYLLGSGSAGFHSGRGGAWRGAR